jgi:hypothetical protein
MIHNNQVKDMKRIKRVCFLVARIIWIPISIMLDAIMGDYLGMLLSPIDEYFMTGKKRKPMELRTRKRYDKNENKKSD